MTVWTAPEIHVLSSPNLTASIKWTGKPPRDSASPGPHTASDTLAECAGRACYWSYWKGRKTNAVYLANIINAGHGSVLEHPHWTFGLAGISRSLSHELVRHRHLSFSQLSQRFVTEAPQFVLPPGIENPSDAYSRWESICLACAAEYANILGLLPDTKSGREAARAVLPNSTATRIVVTGNARALRQMLALRGSAGADAEFRRLAVQWTTLMKSLSPNIFADFSVVDGCVVTEHPKV